MKTLIAVPCMDMVHTLFFKSFVSLRCPPDTDVTVSSSSLIYDARNQLAKQAVEGNYDRLLWLDSDMVFNPDMIERFNEDMDGGLEYVSALYFTRRAPVSPCVYKTCSVKLENGKHAPTCESITELPETPLFQVAASGMGAVMMSVSLVKRVADRYGLPFSPVLGFGEDLSFCMRASELGVPLWCDSRISLGHAGQAIFDFKTWQATRG